MPPRRLPSNGESRRPLRHDFPTELSELLDSAADVARERGERVWAVGGVVRDVLEHHVSADLDLVILGDPAAYAGVLAGRLGGDPRSEARFLTASFTSRSGFVVDVVRARCESYRSPAALPEVRPGTLREDLFRRDFTVNAMAVDLGGSSREVIDLFGGLRDLEARRLRTLHDRSFFDDPTRILRGIRLSARTGMKFEERTRQQATAAVAVGTLDLLSGDRLRGELELLFDDPGAALRSLDHMSEVGLDDAVLSGLTSGAKKTRRLERLAGSGSAPGRDEPRWLAALLALSWDLSLEERQALADRLAMSGPHRRELTTIPQTASGLGAALEALDSQYAVFRIGEALGEFGRRVAAACGSDHVREYLANEWSRLESRRPRISGADLVALGFDSGPAIGDALEATSRARLEGLLEAEAELDFAVGHLRQALGKSVDAGRSDSRRSADESPGDGRRS
jgi:tRNA nucleotidyltransferase (CCA-adding enzyme)